MDVPRKSLVRARRDMGFGLLELLITVAILLILTALLIPGMQAMLRRAAASQCIGNLRQISVASASYSADHDGDWPPNRTDSVNGNLVFADFLIPYLDSVPTRGSGRFAKSSLVCPGDHSDAPETSWMHQGIYAPAGAGPNAYGLSYAQNVALTKSTSKRVAVNRPSSLIAYLDFDRHYVAYRTRAANDPTRRENMKERHDGLLNVAFADGSVRPISIEEVLSADASETLWEEE